MEQVKARLNRQDEEKEEEAFQAHLKEIKADNAKWRAEQAEKERAAERERERLHEGVRHRREQEMKDAALRSWLDAGGTKEEFEEEWPQMRRQMLRARATGDDSGPRREAFRRDLRAF